ncbi:MAG TPA: BsuBI/PstI family type II restriction endonuclease [Planctomycetaceae bacterium]|nr:BsuBI/PstI family type II restriction endonuclease [Planctomycetaceae bacterium]
MTRHSFSMQEQTMAMAQRTIHPDDLQDSFIKRFSARFAPGAVVVHAARTADETPTTVASRLAELGFSTGQQCALPDVVLYDIEKHWLVLAQIAGSSPPMTQERVAELREALAGSDAAFTFVSAFADFDSWGKWVDQIAWQTEVWLAEAPDHMIHFNGERLLHAH